MKGVKGAKRVNRMKSVRTVSEEKKSTISFISIEQSEKLLRFKERGRGVDGNYARLFGDAAEFGHELLRLCFLAHPRPVLRALWVQHPEVVHVPASSGQ